MAGPTQIDQAAFEQIIQQHTQVQEYIDQAQRQVQSEVEQAHSQNSGAMITSLVTVHDEWNEHMDQIGQRLQVMIDAMKTTQRKLEAQDTQNTIR